MLILGDLAALLPDTPRWVETRSLLLTGDGEVFGEDEGAYLVRDPAAGPVFVVGRPTPGVVHAALERGMWAEDVIGPVEEAAFLAEALPGWRGERAIIHELHDDSRLAPPDEHCGIVDPWEFDLPGDAELLVELRAASRRSPIVAAFAGADPVSFCYAGSITQAWWDVSIDTRPPHRRNGHAARCASYMIRLMRARQVAPVWAAMESNADSLGLAARLGFVPTDELIVFSPPSTQ